MPAARLAALFLLAAFIASAAPARADEAAAPPALEPIGGFADGLYLQTHNGQIVLFPGGRLQVDGAFFPRQTPKSGVYLRRARVELRGWLGPVSALAAYSSRRFVGLESGRAVRRAAPGKAVVFTPLLGGRGRAGAVVSDFS